MDTGKWTEQQPPQGQQQDHSAGQRVQLGTARNRLKTELGESQYYTIAKSIRRIHLERDEEAGLYGRLSAYGPEEEKLIFRMEAVLDPRSLEKRTTSFRSGHKGVHTRWQKTIQHVYAATDNLDASNEMLVDQAIAKAAAKETKWRNQLCEVWLDSYRTKLRNAEPIDLRRLSREELDLSARPLARLSDYGDAKRIQDLLDKAFTLFNKHCFFDFFDELAVADSNNSRNPVKLVMDEELMESSRSIAETEGIVDGCGKEHVLIKVSSTALQCGLPSTIVHELLHAFLLFTRYDDVPLTYRANSHLPENSDGENSWCSEDENSSIWEGQKPPQHNKYFVIIQERLNRKFSLNIKLEH